MKKNLIIALIAVFVLGFFVHQNFKKDDEKGAGLLTYTSDVYGLSFDYPESYALTEGPSAGGQPALHTVILVRKEDLPLPQNGEGPTAITIQVFPKSLSAGTLTSWLKSAQESNFNLSGGTYSTTTVAGVPALSYRWSGLYEGKTTVAEVGDYFYSFTATYLTPQDQILKDYDAIVSSVDLRRDAVYEYLKKNIGTLSPEKEVLGGKFYITNFVRTSSSTGVVSYEDGHMAYQADVRFATTNAGEVVIDSFSIRR